MNTNVTNTFAIAAAMLVLALLLGFLALGVGRFMGPRPRPAEQNPPPEHGGRTGHKTWVQFRLRYVVLALLFVAFDMEMVFMFPWAVVYKQVGLVAFFDMFVFVAVLASASFFAWREGAFDWER
jgi:NADH:ubiquinone oxidoreductase subunit 3 (subunit A)